jgi:hypothetical protein
MRGLILGKIETTDLRPWKGKKEQNKRDDRNKAEIDAERVERMIKYCQKNKISYEDLLPTPDEAAQTVDFGRLLYVKMFIELVKLGHKYFVCQKWGKNNVHLRNISIIRLISSSK